MRLHKFHVAFLLSGCMRLFEGRSNNDSVHNVRCRLLEQIQVGGFTRKNSLQKFQGSLQLENAKAKQNPHHVSAPAKDIDTITTVQ